MEAVIPSRKSASTVLKVLPLCTPVNTNKFDPNLHIDSTKSEEDVGEFYTVEALKYTRNKTYSPLLWVNTSREMYFNSDNQRYAKQSSSKERSHNRYTITQQEQRVENKSGNIEGVEGQEHPS